MGILKCGDENKSILAGHHACRQGYANARMGGACGLDASRYRPPQESPAAIAKLNRPHLLFALKLF
jgi:hypothetical protein